MRLRDTREGELPEGIEVGAYWKVLDDQTGHPKLVHHPGKLTEECWRLVVPLARDTGFKNPKFGYAIANLDHHTVREEEDGTISVRPGDGSSNSILVSKSANGPSWHGYVEHGVLREA